MTIDIKLTIHKNYYTKDNYYNKYYNYVILNSLVIFILTSRCNYYLFLTLIIDQTQY